MTKKTIIAFAIAAAIFTQTLSGCSTGVSTAQIPVRKPLEEQSQVASGFLTYMSDKYGKDFDPIPMDGTDIITRPDMLLVREHGVDGDRNCATVLKDSSGIYSDNLYGVTIRSEYETAITELVSTQFSKAKVYIIGYAENSFSEDLTTDTRLEDAIQMGQCPTANIYAFVELPDGTAAQFSTAVSSVGKQIGTAAIPCTMTVFWLAHGKLADIDCSNFETYLPDYHAADGDACLAIKSIAISV